MENTGNEQLTKVLITIAADECTQIQPINGKLKYKKGCYSKNFCISFYSAFMILLWSFLIEILI